MDAIVPAKPFTADDFRVRAALERGPYASADTYGDHSWNPGAEPFFSPDKLRDAAVLVPIVDRGANATMLLTKRTEKMRSHAGQIAFPGGRVDDTDPSPEDAALRETEEEIGLDRSLVELIGRMPDYVTGSGFRVAPVLGIVQPDFLLTINEDEVSDAFEVPLSFLMDPANHVRDSGIWRERERFFYRMPYQQWMIWGVTAGIIRAIYERLYA
jgi:8-oxo-dGTP pyrophosphatase MutT (NUDIX family)